MFGRRSRYRDARVFTAGEDGRPVFAGIRPRRIGPATGAIEHRVQAGDRLDLLARHYFNDAQLWCRIVDANAEFLSAGDIVLAAMEGQTILFHKATE